MPFLLPFLPRPSVYDWSALKCANRFETVRKHDAEGRSFINMDMNMNMNKHAKENKEDGKCRLES